MWIRVGNFEYEVEQGGYPVHAKIVYHFNNHVQVEMRFQHGEIRNLEHVLSCIRRDAENELNGTLRGFDADYSKEV